MMPLPPVTIAFALAAALPAPAAPAVIDPDATCIVRRGTGEAASGADVERARAGCATARARFGELFGGPVPTVQVVLWDWPGYRLGTEAGAALIFWPTTVAMSVAAGDGDRGAAHVADQWRNVLPHEISHALLAARFFPAADAPTDGYGTPFPDWLDEAVAIWAESPDNRRGRVAEARSLPAARQELGSILTMPHPATGSEQALAIRDGAPIPQDAALWAFYPQSFAVLAFLHEVGGRAAVLGLVQRLQVGADPAAGVALLAGLSGLPATPAGVLRAWSRWLATP
jgi:hypothetical protein